MKLVKFRIQNYNSIIDSGYCNLISGVPQLSGRSELQRKHILKSLREFAVEYGAITEVQVLPHDHGEPLLELYFEISENELNEICKAIASILPQEDINSILSGGLKLYKSPGAYYILSKEQHEVFQYGFKYYGVEILNQLTLDRYYCGNEEGCPGSSVLVQNDQDTDVTGVVDLLSDIVDLSCRFFS